MELRIRCMGVEAATNRLDDAEKLVHDRVCSQPGAVDLFNRSTSKTASALAAIRTDPTPLSATQQQRLQESRLAFSNQSAAIQQELEAQKRFNQQRAENAIASADTKRGLMERKLEQLAAEHHFQALTASQAAESKVLLDKLNAAEAKVEANGMGYLPALKL